MKIGLVSESKDPTITIVVMRQIADACELQLYRDYASLWQADGVQVMAFEALAQMSSEWAPLVVFDDADAPNALGYHDTAPNGRPYGRIFWGPISASGGTLMRGPLSLSCVISHEILETVGDPYCNGWWLNPGDGALYAQELCDPVEGDAYEIDGGVSVSNFIGPRWADPGGAGPYDQMGKLEAPFTMTAGGYMIKMVGGEVQQVFGEKHVQRTRSRAPRRMAR